MPPLYAVSEFDNIALVSDHYYFCLQSYQVNRLRRLKQLANTPIAENRIVTFADFLYAVLWRCLNDLQATTRAKLTIIQNPYAPLARYAERGTATPSVQINDGLEMAVIDIASTALAEWPLVDVARYIRRHLTIASEQGLAVSPQGIVCTALPLPALQRANFGFTAKHAAGQPNEEALRVCCINRPTVPDGILSIDILLPHAELLRFKSRYGDGHGVPNCFFR